MLVTASASDLDRSPDKPWLVYLLACRGGRLYTGVTPDLLVRMLKHRSGRGARFTRAHPPESLLAAKSFPSRGAAQAMEFEVKRMSAAAKRVLAVTWSREFEIGADVRAVFA